MAKTKARSLLTKEYFKKLLEIDESQLKQIGEFAADRIRSFARTGKSLVTGQPKEFEPLAASTVKSRKSFAANHRTGDFFRAEKSNVTLTGQALESLAGKVEKSKQRVTVEAVGKRDDGLTNAQVVDFLAEGGRPIMGLDEKGEARVVEMYDRAVRNNIRKKQKG